MKIEVKFEPAAMSIQQKNRGRPGSSAPLPLETSPAAPLIGTTRTPIGDGAPR